MRKAGAAVALICLLWLDLVLLGIAIFLLGHAPDLDAAGWVGLAFDCFLLAGAFWGTVRLARVLFARRARENANPS
jgi:hypothetical protein